MRRKFWKIIYPDKTEFGKLIFQIENLGHSPCSGPAGSLCLVPFLSTKHGRNFWSIQRLWGFKASSLLLAHREEWLGNIAQYLLDYKFQSASVVCFLHAYLFVSWCNPFVLYISVIKNIVLLEIGNNLIHDLVQYLLPVFLGQLFKYSEPFPDR